MLRIIDKVFRKVARDIHQEDHGEDRLVSICRKNVDISTFVQILGENSAEKNDKNMGQNTSCGVKGGKVP